MCRWRGGNTPPSIGTDWPLQAPTWVLDAVNKVVAEHGFRDEHAVEAHRNLVGFDNYHDFPNITRGLVARGYTDREIAGILGATCCVWSSRSAAEARQLARRFLTTFPPCTTMDTRSRSLNSFGSSIGLPSNPTRSAILPTSTVPS